VDYVAVTITAAEAWKLHGADFKAMADKYQAPVSLLKKCQQTLHGIQN